MGKHRRKDGDHQSAFLTQGPTGSARGTGPGRSPDEAMSTDVHRSGVAVDPEDERLIEPDRDAEPRLSEEERRQRVDVHTDRSPEDDLRQAAARAQQDDPATEEYGTG